MKSKALAAISNIQETAVEEKEPHSEVVTFESLTQRAKDLKSKLERQTEGLNQTFIEFLKVLSQIHKEKRFARGNGFRDFIENELQIQKSQAYAYLKTYAILQTKYGDDLSKLDASVLEGLGIRTITNNEPMKAIVYKPMEKWADQMKFVKLKNTSITLSFKSNEDAKQFYREWLKGKVAK